MDDPFQCKVPKLQSQAIIVQSNKVATVDHELKALADRWHWNVDLAQAGRLDRLMGKFSHQYNLSRLHPVIENEVHKAFAACNITEPILVLQDENSTNSRCYLLVDELYYPVKAMAIGIADARGDTPLPLIRCNLYHECGHIVAGDVNQPSLKQMLPFIGLILATGIAAGIKTYSALKNKHKVIRLGASVIAGCAAPFIVGHTYHKTIEAYYSRKKEANADLFAIKKLIELKDFEPLFCDFIDLTSNIDNGHFNMKNEASCFHSHPSYYKRAQAILNEFKKQNIDVAALPVEESIRQKFIEQRKKHFPNYFTC